VVISAQGAQRIEDHRYVDPLL
jgi:hypothetical protein